MAPCFGLLGVVQAPSAGGRVARGHPEAQECCRQEGTWRQEGTVSSRGMLMVQCR